MFFLRLPNIFYLNRLIYRMLYPEKRMSHQTLKFNIYCIVMSCMFVSNHLRNSTLARLQRSAQKDFL